MRCRAARIPAAAPVFRLEEAMKAVVYEGPRQVRIKDVPDPIIAEPTDVIVQITSTNICGSDLHMYEGRTEIEKGRVLGHENLGQVKEVAPPWPRKGRRLGLHAIQYQLWPLPELRERADRFLPDHQS